MTLAIAIKYPARQAKEMPFYLINKVFWKYWCWFHATAIAGSRTFMTSKDFSFPPTHPEEYSSLR
jgi:hypothetical protein